MLDRLQKAFPRCHRAGRTLLLNADCNDVMKQISSDEFDLACVDPPYSWNSGNAFTSRLKKYGQLEYNDNRPTSEYFNELRRTSVNQIIWGGNYFLTDLQDTKCMIFWYKHQPVDTYADGEIAWTSFGDRHSAIFDYKYFGAINREKDRFHPNQKPVTLYKWLLNNYAKPGQRILDTHLGSGSSAIAAHYFGCDFVGIELDEDYYKAAKERFDKSTRQLALF
jgi:site-specific DNA-methyltransferase (adenine-specific)